MAMTSSNLTLRASPLLGATRPISISLEKPCANANSNTSVVAGSPGPSTSWELVTFSTCLALALALAVPLSLQPWDFHADPNPIDPRVAALGVGKIHRPPAQRIIPLRRDILMGQLAHQQIPKDGVVIAQSGPVDARRVSLVVLVDCV